MNICLKTSARHVVAAVLEIYSDLTVRQTLTEHLNLPPALTSAWERQSTRCHERESKAKRTVEKLFNHISHPQTVKWESLSPEASRAVRGEMCMIVLCRCHLEERQMDINSATVDWRPG